MYGAGQGNKAGMIVILDSASGKVKNSFGFAGMATVLSNRYRSILLANDPLTAGNYNLFGHIMSSTVGTSLNINSSLGFELIINRRI